VKEISVIRGVDPSVERKKNIVKKQHVQYVEVNEPLWIIYKDKCTA
jgi:hypothetical protein